MTKLAKLVDLTLMVCVVCIAHVRKTKSAMTGKLLWSIIRRLRKKHLGILRDLMIDVK